jgi:hypothetical protein
MTADEGSERRVPLVMMLEGTGFRADGRSHMHSDRPDRAGVLPRPVRPSSTSRSASR